MPAGERSVLMSAAEERVLVPDGRRVMLMPTIVSFFVVLSSE